MLQQFNEKNRDLIVNIDGRLVHRDEAGISPFDSAVQGGDAVWEGLRLYNGRIFKLHEHLDRLERSARALSFVDVPSREVRKRSGQTSSSTAGRSMPCSLLNRASTKQPQIAMARGGVIGRRIASVSAPMIPRPHISSDRPTMLATAST